MTSLDLSTYSLEDRFTRIVKELSRIPDQEEMEEVPYFSRVLDSIIEVYTSFESYVEGFEKNLRVEEEPFPSFQQKHTAAVIATRERVIIGDEPGTRKTGSALLAKYAIQKRLGSKIKTVVLCPGYLLNNWIAKIDEYLVEEPSYCVISSRDKMEDIRRAASEDVDIILASYDVLYKDLDPEDCEDCVDEDLEIRADVLFNSYQGNRASAVRTLENFADFGRDMLTEYEITGDSSLEEICLAIAREEDNEEEVEKRTVFRELIKVLTSADPDEEITRHNFYLIADEFHNVRDTDLKKKTNAFYQLGQRARFAAFLSGTKTPDDIDNIAVVASILDNERFPRPETFTKSFINKSSTLRGFLNQWEKKPKLCSKDITGCAIPETKVEEFELNELESQVYLLIQNSPFLRETEKLILLRYATMDVSLVDPVGYKGSKRMKNLLEETFEGEEELLSKIEGNTSSRQEALERVLARIPEGDKFIVFSKYSRGVMQPLEERLESVGYNVVRVDQSVSSENRKIRLTKREVAKLRERNVYRDQVYRIDLKKNEKEVLGLTGKRFMHHSKRDMAVLEFQTNPDLDGIIATFGTIREGRNLHSGNHIIPWDREYQPGVERQAKGRAAGRSGQEKECFITALQAVNTVDVGIAAHVDWKGEQIDRAETGRVIGVKAARSVAGRVSVHKDRHINSYLRTSTQMLRSLLAYLSGQGVEGMQQLVEQGQAALFAEAFNYRWGSSLSANRGRLIKMGMDHLGISPSEVVELGSGSAQMARILERPTTCVDYLEEQLRIGRMETEKLGFDIETHCGSIHSMPFLDDGRFDLSIASNVYNLLAQKERVLAVGENWRILKEEGYGVWVFPPSAIDEDGTLVNKLKQDFGHAGFSVNEELTGRYVVTEAVDLRTGREVNNNITHFLLAAQRTEGERVLDDKMFQLPVDFTFVKGRKKKRGMKAQDIKIPEVKSEMFLGFRNIDTGLKLENKVERLREMIKKSIEDGKYTGQQFIQIIESLLAGESEQ